MNEVRLQGKIVLIKISEVETHLKELRFNYYFRMEFFRKTNYGKVGLNLTTSFKKIIVFLLKYTNKINSN